MVVTLVHGAFEAREVRKICAAGHGVSKGSEVLRRLVRPGQRYGYDVIVEVGLRRYLAGAQREEIRSALLEQHGLSLSTGTISALCDRFLGLLAALHVYRAPQLRAALDGGYPLHIDATCDQGRGGLLVCMDGWRGWVLRSGRISSEAAEQVRPTVQETVALFGTPVAIVRDMGSGVSGAVARLREAGIPDLICHYHFLAAVGQRLLDRRHQALRGMIRVARVRTKMRLLLADLQRYRASRDGRLGPGSVRDNLRALVLWLLEGNGAKEAPFPFALPHLEFVRRCRQAMERVDQWVPCPRTQPERRAVRHLSYLVSHLERDQRLPSHVDQLEERWRLFVELRDVLRLSTADLPHGQSGAQARQIPALELVRLEQIKKEVEAYQGELQRSLSQEEATARRPSSPQGIILRALKSNLGRLFGHPARLGPDGRITAVVSRTNNILEQFFGEQKRQLRRRLGRAHLGRDLEQQPAEAAYVANLRYPTYVRVLCGSLDHLPEAFAALDIGLGSQPWDLVRDHRDKALQQQVHKLLSADAERDQSVNMPPDAPPHGLQEPDLVNRWQELQILADDELLARAAGLFPQPGQKVPKERDPRLPPAGTVVSRRWRNRTHRVLVAADGFEYAGSRYAHLSAIAREITGKPYNGYRFFHLTRPWGSRPRRRAARRRRRRMAPSVGVTTES